MTDSVPPLGARLRAIDLHPRTLSLVRPLTGPLTYLGWRVRGSRVPVYAFFDHTSRAIAYPLRFAVTTCRDWRGLQLTYDKHLGTDFIVPPGTLVTAAARGVVLKVSEEPVGGPFIWVDHGGGFATTYHHLSQVLVREGQQVHRGEVIARSGGRGLAIESFFPLVPPHLHFGLAVDGVPADPFPGPDSPGFWADGVAPVPHDFERELDVELPYEWIDKGELLARFAEDPVLGPNFIPPMELIAPDRLSYRGDWRDLAGRPAVRLSLPFRAEDVSGIAYP